MAIPISQQPQRIHWFGWLVTLLILCGLGFIAYQIWFSPDVVFKKLDNAGEKDTYSAIAQSNFDPTTVVGSKKFINLQERTPRVGPGNIGRQNPFLPF